MVEAMEHQTPSCITLCTLMVTPSYQGRGKGEKARPVIQIIASRISGMLYRIGCEAKEMMTGTQTRAEKGLASPTVISSNPQSCKRSRLSRAKAAGGSSRCVGG